MLNVLVVEDNTRKLKEIVRCLTDGGLCSVDAVQDVRDANSAKNALKEKRFDLVVLDVALPLRSDMDPSPNGGLDLLEEICSRDLYLKPDHIVGLTAFAAVLDEAKCHFDQNLWSVIKFEENNEEWKSQLQRKLRHIQAAKSAAEDNVGYESDLCILTALKETELQAVLNLPWGFEKHPVKHDATLYYKGAFGDTERQRVVYAASASQMGMPVASALAMKMINRFRPRYFVMTGILAGAKGDTQLGDVICANPCWDWGSGKHTSDENGVQFAQAPYQCTVDPELAGVVERVQADDEFLFQVYREWSGNKPRTNLKLHAGPIASGASVLADEQYFASIKKQHRKLLGIDMEAYGVMAAVEISPFPQPKVCVLKSVCDFADAEKSDDFQQYAAYSSARIMAKIFEAILLN